MTPFDTRTRKKERRKRLHFLSLAAKASKANEKMMSFYFLCYPQVRRVEILCTLLEFYSFPSFLVIVQWIFVLHKLATVSERTFNALLL